MITQIDISNFRSIKKQSIPLKKINILYGPNGSGKSSVMYAPYVMRNFFVNPNQRLNNLFNLGFISLGNIENVIFNGNNNSAYEIEISITSDIESHFVRNEDDFAKSSLTLSKNGVFGNSINFKIAEFEEKLEIQIPYAATEKKEVNFGEDAFIWNGLTFEKFDRKKDPARFYSFELNRSYEDIKSIEIISVRRGFFSPIFSTEMDNSEESKFALQVREEGLDFDVKIDGYFSKIFDKNFRFVAVPGSNSFYLRTHNKSGFTTDLVNEGFGVNQTIYMLIKLLKKSTSLAFIEEPEIHLHPSAQLKLVDVFTEIVLKENKQIFITTHSENIVSSVLSKIASQELSKNDVQFYLSKTENGETKIIPQAVNENGQIEGGLMSFMETECSILFLILFLTRLLCFPLTIIRS